MGSGKSTLGKKLASLLSYNFVDLDNFIEQQSGSSISRIFQEKGETYFREVETNCLKDVLAVNTRTVVALGGGTVCFHNNIEKIKQAGVLVFIDLPAKALAQRLSTSKQERPLLKKFNEEQLISYIDDMLETRKTFYRQAHISLKGLNLSAHDIYSALLEYASKH